MFRVLLFGFFIISASAQPPGAARSPGGKGAEALLQTERDAWPAYALKAERSWLLNLPQGREFGASGLLLLTNGDLLTVSDRLPTLYRIQFPTNGDAADLVAVPNVFTASQLKKYAREKISYYDTEGIARDDLGRLYICEEANRWVLRCDPATGIAERLEIDWSPVKKYFSSDRNASFEGIAIGNGKLFVANERSTAVIIVVDFESLKVVHHFQVFPRKPSFLGTHYSDLSWFAGKLYVLCRQHRVILEVDPETRKITAEFDYTAVEDQLGYMTQLPVGVMEGLAVTADFFWLATDNNGMPRLSAPKDTRPSVVKLPRPDRRQNAPK